MSTKFFNNSLNNTVFEKFKGVFENMKDLYAFHAVVGYFRSSGYFVLQEYLRDVNDIKILVGINVDEIFAESQRKGLLYFGDEEKTKDEFLKWFIQDLKEAKYTEQVEKGILDFINDIIDGRIEVRAHNSKAIHAKFYLFLPENHSEHSDGWVIMGSSNLTNAGLGIKKSPNYELNIALKDYDDVQFAKGEFATLWDESTTILPADIQEFKKKTHIGQLFSPFEIYIKFLIEYFNKNIDYDPDTVGDLPKSFKKLSYQVDAVNQGYQMLMEHNGFFLSDVVGLGKTVVAAMIAKRFIIANGSQNTKILVVYPPAVEKNWKSTFKTFGIDKHTKFITNGRLEKILNGNDINYWPSEEYDLILVDEAHKYRNHTSRSFGYLQRICKAPRLNSGNVSGSRKKIMLISATPLNNRPQDLYYQLLLFQDGRRSTLPETNLQSFFGDKVKRYKEIMKEEEPNVLAIKEIYNDIREKIISQITVRRTRRDLKAYPKYINDLKDQGIIFPEIAPLKAIEYDLDSKIRKLFFKTIFYLTDNDKIEYLRYQAIAYLNVDLRDTYYDQAVLVSTSLAGIMKTLMVKRLESSFHAFRISLKNLLISSQRMIDMFQNDKILIAPDLNINQLIEKGFSMEEIEEQILEMSIENPKNNVFSAADFKDEFLVGLMHDRDLLMELCKEWENISDDPKLKKLYETFDNEIFNKEINPTGQLIIFTESNDTADYLFERISEHTDKGILKISSENRNKIFSTIQQNFDANYAGKQKNDYQILITTDVLAEGVNLHRANVLINYDTPWNATRLMQRTGRINRIGSLAGVVYNYNFYPSQYGDEEIKLYKSALIKLQGFHSAFGEDAQIFTKEEMVQQFELFKEGMPDEEDKRLHYLRFIREFKDSNPREFKRIQKFPLKARTARKTDGAPNSASSVIFLKSALKMEFYKVDDKVVPITFIQAAELFESASNEVGHPMPNIHYNHVQEALNDFENNIAQSTTESVTTDPNKDNTDAISKQSKKHISDVKGFNISNELNLACDEIITLIQNGTFTQLPNEVKKLKRDNEKNKITHAQMYALIIALAKKYKASVASMPQEKEEEITPEIVITETFFQ